ncbi:NAD(P)H-dependent oxidoreductase [Dactylosporangium sp. NPDC049525]|uniref:NADPH-dependent FMN reductase n=1 Tax=Dactylosporangium sp. NPDC049525 TaxID=3154730 RepID=UPI0034433708
MTPLRVAVIIGSTREGRMGDRVGRWFVERAGERDDMAVTAVDLADYDFPGSYPAEATAAMRLFVRRVDEAEAFVVVTPEYNHSFPASLKQAIDYAYDEWQAKPVGFVSYGCRSTGQHAVDQLRTVFTALHAVTVSGVVAVDLLCGEPTPLAEDQLRRDATVMLDQLGWWGLTLRDGRAARPYIC